MKVNHFINAIVLYVLSAAIFPLGASALDKRLTYFDAAWKPCREKKASYFRMAVRSVEGWDVQDFYISGKLQMLGSYSDSAQEVKTGHFVYYYENGNKSEEGDYMSGKKQGDWTSWHKNGVEESRGAYEKGERNGTWTFWDDYAKKTSSGAYKNGEEDGRWNFWYGNGELRQQGSYKQGKQAGLWAGWYRDGGKEYVVRMKDGSWDGAGQWYFENGQISADEVYDTGTRVKGTYWSEKGEELPYSAGDVVMPAYPGGDEARQAFLNKELIYPKKARRQDVQGKVTIRFVVNEDGSIGQTEVTAPVHPLIDGEALRVVGIMPKWTPGRIHNQVVKVYFTLPIIFTLE
jgi:TonB family protein